MPTCCAKRSTGRSASSTTGRPDQTRRSDPVDLITALVRLRDDLLTTLLPPRLLRSQPRVVKRKVSNYLLKRAEHRAWPQPTRTHDDAVTIRPPRQTAQQSKDIALGPGITPSSPSPGLLSHLPKREPWRALGSPWGEVMRMISSPCLRRATDQAFKHLRTLQCVLGVVGNSKSCFLALRTWSRGPGYASQSVPGWTSLKTRRAAARWAA